MALIAERHITFRNVISDKLGIVATCTCAVFPDSVPSLPPFLPSLFPRATAYCPALCTLPVLHRLPTYNVITEKALTDSPMAHQVEELQGGERSQKDRIWKSVKCGVLDACQFVYFIKSIDGVPALKGKCWCEYLTTTFRDFVLPFCSRG